MTRWMSFGVGLLLSLNAWATPWSQIESEARGQTVYFYAWGGSPQINAYIDRWAEKAEQQYGMTVRHVKVEDIATVITGIQTARLTGQSETGGPDLLWINGENFARMKREQLLGSPFVSELPNANGLDLDAPANAFDFSIPTEGLEMPWGRAQLVWLYDRARTTHPPKSLEALLTYAENNPGTVTYPEPPNFHGTTFLKQAVLETTAYPKWLSEPFQPERLDSVTENLWPLLDALHAVAWRQGREFPDSAEALLELFADGVLDIALSFNPNEASNRILEGQLPSTVRTYVHDAGSIGNTHFVAIPFNASARAGALVWANMLLSPSAQAEKSDPAVWGDPTVLAMDRLDPESRALFDAIGLGPATLSPEALGNPLPEPHASWTEPLEQAWRQRYLSASQ